MPSFQTCFEEVLKFLENVFSDHSFLKEFKDKTVPCLVDDEAKILSSLDTLIVFLQNFKNEIEISMKSTESSCSSDDVDVEMSNETSKHEVPQSVSMETDDTLDSKQAVLPKVNIDLVQIKAPNSEIDRRIAAFIEQKQSEVDEINKREFCSTALTQHNEEDSCARVDSVFVKRVDGKSHIKVSRVVNYLGPQTLHHSGMLSPSRIKKEPGTDPGEISEGIQERIQNVETHLKCQGPKESKQDVFSRLKKLEERILYLESLSPEYFNDRFIPMPKRKKPQQSVSGPYSSQSEMSMTDLDLKMQQLREELQLKAMNR